MSRVVDRPGALAARAFDVIVVGSGAGGCAATYRLAQAGLRVLLVERGRALPRDGTTLSVQKVIHEGAFKSTELWRDSRGVAFAPEEHFNLGGKTKWYGAALARFDAAEFAGDEARGYSPWPFGLEEIAPYYDEIEALLGVRRFECEPGLDRIVKRLSRVSQWRADPLPLALSAEILNDAHEAAHFDGFASARDLKSDGQNALLARIANAPNLTILTGHAVAALERARRDPARIGGVRLDDGTVLAAREVVLAAGAMHSPRLLERYVRAASLQRLPLANVIGRNFKLHILTAVLVFGAARQTDLIRKTVLLTNPRLPHSSVQPLGFDGELIATLLPRIVPRAAAGVLGRRAYGFFLQTEDGSSTDNRVVDGGDDRPLLDYDAGRCPLALAEHRLLVGLFRADLLRAGYPSGAQRIGSSGTAHACGTLVTGRDPTSAAVDPAGRVHGLRGLTVADGSVLPRVSRVNPALTIYAWGLRAAAMLAARLKAEDRADAVAATAPAMSVVEAVVR